MQINIIGISRKSEIILYANILHIFLFRKMKFHRKTNKNKAYTNRYPAAIKTLLSCFYALGFFYVKSSTLAASFLGVAAGIFLTKGIQKIRPFLFGRIGNFFIDENKQCLK